MIAHVEQQVQALERLDLEGLRSVWRARYGNPPALRSALLLRLMLAWRIQAQALGGLDRDARHKLKRRGRLRPEGLDLGTGAVLRRAWQGRTVEVEVTEDGFRWDGAVYPSRARFPIDMYDGGFSGGSMERPALKRLLADIAAGRVDVIVVYKIDRLTRSLPDFARMVELFDRHNVSFVSVTQAFNTTTSMGRLTLNVLLSFAQFEREVTGERIRDKIAASKAKGMWMGGRPPLGYDLPTDTSRALVVNDGEAATVRTIFATYLELGSVHALERWLSDRGILSKARVTRNGRAIGGRPFSRGALFHLLRNRTYLGLIVHKDAVHPGAHPGILDADLFASVQALLSTNARRHKASPNRVAGAALTGRIFDADGQPMSPTFSHGASGRVYRYYVSAPLQQGRRRTVGDDAIRRVSANMIEARVVEILERLLAGQSDPLSHFLRVEIHSASLELLLPAKGLATLRSRLGPGELLQPEPESAAVRIITPIWMQLRGGRTLIVGAGPRQTQPDRSLVKALRTAHSLLSIDRSGLPVLEVAPSARYHRRLVRLAFLAPELQSAILEGRQPPGLTLEQLIRNPIPELWSAQQAMIAAPCS